MSSVQGGHGERRVSGVHIWDVVVVGAGPAGASAALAAASTGRRVLLLEKAEWPRYKTCGGGLIGPSFDALPPGVSLPLRDRVHAVTFTRKGALRRTRRARLALFGLVDRAEFDAALVRAAMAAGAQLRTRAAVLRVESASGGRAALVLAGGERVLTRAVVGADGSASRISRYVGVKLAEVDLGLEGATPVPGGVPLGWGGGVRIDWGPIPGSYGWVFPKGDTLTVGVIAARGHGPATRRYLTEFIAELGLADFEPRSFSGHLTRCRAGDSPLFRDRALVCGDAAGLLEPWTREGISFALRSGRLAGQWAVRIAEARDTAEVAEQGRCYARAIEGGLGREMAVGRRLLGLCERHPGLVHAALSGFRPAWQVFTQFTRGTTTLPEIVRTRPLARLLLWALGRS